MGPSKQLFKSRLEDLRKCVSNRIYLQVVVIWLNAITGFNDGIIKIHSPGYYTIVFVSCDPVPVDRTRTQITSSFETEDIFQEELPFNLEKVMAMKIVL